MQSDYKEFSGRASVNNAAASAAVIAAPGAGKRYRIVGGIINVTLAATGATGTVAVRDGSTDIITVDANAVGTFPFYFSESNGYPVTANTAINLVAANAGTNQASANVALVGYIVG